MGRGGDTGAILAAAARAACRTLTLEEMDAEAMPLLRRALGAAFVALTSFDENGRPWGRAGDLDQLEPGLYFPTYAGTDPIQKLLTRWHSRVFLADRHVAPGALERSAVFGDYYRPRDIGHVLAARVAADRYYAPGGLTLAFFRARRQPAFDAADARNLKRVLPYLDMAAQRHRRLEELLREPTVEPDQGEPLTAAELTVHAALREGLSNAAIARRLFIGVPTVKTHVHRILAKLGVSSRLQAALRGPGRRPT